MTMLRLSLSCVLLIALWVEAQYFFDECEEGFCKKTENACPEMKCEEGKGRIVKNATKCGCCHICIKSLREDATCRNIQVGMNNEKLEECGPGLICSSELRCVPADTKCIEEQMLFDEDPANSTFRQRPQCDHFGFFKPVVCNPDELCYCVDKNGNRIFGTDLAANNESMNCDCSREIRAFPRSVPDGKFPRCLPNGNYDPLQCTETECYCMDSMSTEGVNINASLETLPCYDRDLHQNRATCWEQRAKQKEVYKNESFTGVIGLDLVSCDLDGSFFPVQCVKDKCFCVTKDGNQYERNKYAVRNSEAAKRMTCDCLRDKEFLQKTGYIIENEKPPEIPLCDNLGNYNRVKQ